MTELEEASFQQYLEFFVDMLPEESAPYFEERPRYAHSVLILANPAIPGELMKASYVKQLDPVMLINVGRTEILSVDETPNARKISSSSQVEVPVVQIKQSGRVWHADDAGRKGETTVSTDYAKSYSGDSSTASLYGSEPSRGWNAAKDIHSEIPVLVDRAKPYNRNDSYDNLM
ncbi:Protein C10B5.3 [Aphelenchoides avenae]|nr:Protein C10B5.3 [Aphelenchus avenae]